MGEISDMMLDGTLDEQTGEYIGPAVGYPRTKQPGHYNSMNRHEKHNNYNGIIQYINKYYDNKLPSIPKNKIGTWTRYYHSIIREFLKNNNIDHINNNKLSTVFNNARKAQKDWKKFKEFLEKRNWEYNININL